MCAVSMSGAVVGVMVVASDFDLLPYGAVFGEAIGALSFGLAGLLWRPSVSRSTLKWLASATLVIAALAILGIRLASDQTCLGSGQKGHPCLRHRGSGVMLVWLALNAGLVALMFLAQVPLASDIPRRERERSVDRLPARR